MGEEITQPLRTLTALSGPEFKFYHPHTLGGLQMPETLPPSDSMIPPGLCGQPHIHINRQNKILI